MTSPHQLVVGMASRAGRLLVAATPTPQPADIDPTTGKGAEWGKAAPIGLLVIVLLCIACYFLARSFSRNLKKVPKSFDSVPDDAGAPPAAGSEPRAEAEANVVASHTTSDVKPGGLPRPPGRI